MADQTHKLATHGGARRGSGRKPDLVRQLKRAEKLAVAMKVGVEGGLGELSLAYKGLMLQAIDLAERGDKQILLKLLDLLPKSVKLTESDEDNPFLRLMKQWAQGGPQAAPRGTIKVMELSSLPPEVDYNGEATLLP